MTHEDDLSWTRFSDHVRVAQVDRVGFIRLDRGDGLNALSVQAMEELTAVADHFGRDVETTALVLTGGPAYFSAGADLNDPALRERRTLGLLAQRQALKVGPDMCAAWERLEQVTVCAVEGFCIGGGVALAVACDLRVAGRGAFFRLPEVPLGMNMSWQTNPRTVNLIGPAKAKLFTILGERLNAGQALDWGLIDQLTEDGEAFAQARGLAERFAALPPLGVRMSKQAIDAAAKPLNYTASYMDRDQFALAATSEDQAEAISAFLEKRKPDFSGS